MRSRAIGALACGAAAVAACNTTSMFPEGTGGGAGGGGSRGGGDGGLDASTDGPSLPAGVFAIPLSTPADADQGAFYTPTLAASGTDFLLDLDTGSTDTAIAGTSCASCTGLSPLYMPGASAKPTGGSDSATYADGSMWTGNVYSDTVGLKYGTPDVALDLVDITSQTSFFSSDEYQGILGMGPDALLGRGTTAFPDQLVAKGIADVMAVELCPTDGTLWFGGFDPTHAGSAMLYTPLLSTGVNAGYYSVDMTGISFGPTSLGATSATLDGPIVDTGTSLFYIPSAAEANLVADINADAAFRSLFPGQTLANPTNATSESCVTAATGVTDAQIDSELPPLVMTFAGVGGGSITLDALPLASYFEDVGGGQYCLVIQGGGDNGEATLGDTFLRGFVTEIDRTHAQVGFAATSFCAAPDAARDAARPRPSIRERGRGPHHGAR